MKHCKKCNAPKDEKLFVIKRCRLKDGTCKSYITNTCKKFTSEIRKEWLKKNMDRKKILNKRWRQKNKLHIKQKRRNHYIKNKNDYSIYHKEWIEKNPEQYKLVKDAWVKKNREKVRVSSKLSARRSIDILSDKYVVGTIVNSLKRTGHRISSKDVYNHPDLIETQRLIIKAKRLTKKKK